MSLKIPEYAAKGAGGAPTGGGRMNPAPVGDGLSVVSRSLEKVGREIVQRRDENDLRQALVDFDRGVFELRKTFDQDEDLATAEKRFKTELETVGADQREHMSSFVREHLGPMLDARKLEAEANYRNFVIKKDADNRVARANESLDFLANKAVYADSPEAFDAAGRQIGDLLGSLKAFVPASKLEAMRDGLENKIYFQKAKNQIEADPSQKFDPEEWFMLPPEQVEQLEDHRTAVIKQRNAEYKKYRTEQAEAETEEFWGRMNEGDRIGASEVWNSMKFTKQKTRNAMKKALKEDKQEKPQTDYAAYNRTAQDIFNSDRNVTKPWINEQVGISWTWEDAKKLTAMLDSRDEGTNVLMKKALKTVEKALLKPDSDYGFQQPTALSNKLAYEAAVDFNQRIARAREEGRDIAPMLTPGSKEYIVDAVIGAHGTTAAERVEDEARTVKENIKNLKDESESTRRLPGETVQEHWARTGGK